jgi:transposase
MATRYTDEFRRDAVRIAISSGLTRPRVSSDLGVGLSTLNKWVQKHQHDDLMSGPHEDVEKENTRLRKEVRLLREEREVLKRRQSTDRQGYAKHDPEWFLCRPKSPLMHGNMHCRAVDERQRQLR